MAKNDVKRFPRDFMKNLQWTHILHAKSITTHVLGYCMVLVLLNINIVCTLVKFIGVYYSIISIPSPFEPVFFVFLLLY